MTDVRLPLRRQLEEFDIVPLHAVDNHWKSNTFQLGRSINCLNQLIAKLTFEQGMMGFGLTDQPVDALNHLTLARLRLLFLLRLLLAQSHN